jgi:hypothetical protein
MTLTRVHGFEKGEPTMERKEAEASGLTLPPWVPLALIVATFALAVVFVLSTSEGDAPGPTP